MKTVRRRGFTRRPTLLSLCLAALIATFGCGGEPAREESPPPPAPASEGPVFTIALVPERNVFEQKKRYAPLQDYLSTAIGRPVAFKLLDNYQMIFTEIIERRADGAFFGSMNGAIAQLKGAVEILARPVELSGVSTYTGYIFSKLDSGITRDPRTWKDKRIALVNKVTTAGYLYPLALLRRSGYRGDLEAYFSATNFTGSHDAAILAVFNGESDLGACKNTVFEEYVKFHPEIQRDLAVLTVSAEVPSNGLGVSPSLDPDLKRRLREALLQMNDTEDGQRSLRQFKAQRFVGTSKNDYQPVFDMAREAGLNLSDWPLRDIH